MQSQAHRVAGVKAHIHQVFAIGVVQSLDSWDETMAWE
jgi:hypothetical protein